MPAAARAISVALRSSASMSRPAMGRTWMVTSRLTSDCQSLAALTTSITAPAVSEARKVIIATTATRERPAIEPLGTIGATLSEARARIGAASKPSHASVMGSIGLVIDMQASFVQHQAAGVVIVHQRDVVGGDDHRGPRLVELDEEPQQSLSEIGIDIAGRLVGKQ